MDALIRLLTNTFIIVWLSFVTTWCLPKGAFLHGLFFPLEKFVTWSGLWHGWGMFMTPPDANRRFSATIIYADGTEEEWASALHNRTGFWQSLVAGMVGKLEENQLCRDDSYLHVPVAEYLSRNLADPQRNVQCVRLYRHWRMIPAPGEPCNFESPFNRHQLLEWRPPGVPP